MTDKNITQERLKELLFYSPQFGIFVWKTSRGSAAKGSIAGSVNDRGYITIIVDSEPYRAHRLAFFYVTRQWPDQIDHSNGIRSDNRICNLLKAGHSENMKNRVIATANRSGVTGVHLVSKVSKWQAEIGNDGQKIHIGLFKDFFEACCARKSMELKLGYHKNHGQERRRY